MENTLTDAEMNPAAEMSPEDEAREQERIRLLLDRLDAFGASLTKTRSEAIDARRQSGIEDIWREDEEFYEGIDDLNRGDEVSIMRQKPPMQAAPRVRGVNRSRVFPNITGPFVDSAAAHVSDILVPTDERPWSYEPTPVPELEELAQQFQQEQPDQAKAKAKQGLPGRMKQAFTGQQANETEQRNDQLVDQQDKQPEEAFNELEQAKAKAEATETRVWDWHVECQWHGQVREVIEDSAKVGTGILKGPFPKSKKHVGWKAASTDDKGNEVPGEIYTKRDITPGSKRIDYWNFFPAPGCGDDIQKGEYVWERDYISKKQLRDLKGQKGYIDLQIQRCLEEGPKRATGSQEESHQVQADPEKKGMYEIWYFHGCAERDDLMAAGCDCEDKKDAYIETMVVVVNDHVIKAALPAMDHGGYPYDVFCWRKRKNFWAGIGVARMIRVAQKIVVGGTRNMMDNAGLAGGPMIVFKQGSVFPADGVAGIGPRKVFYISKDDQTIQDARQAIGSVKVDMMVNELMQIIQFGLQLAEQTTGLPMLMQGQMGNAPDRVGVVNVLNRNSNANLRRLARNFSDDVTGPHLRRYYIWHLHYGPDEEKGDLQVNVKGYGAVVEREIQNQQLPSLLGICVDPRFGLDPKKVGKELLKSWRLNSADLELDDEQWEELLGNWQQMMESAGNDPRVQVAEINANARLEAAKVQGEYRGAEKVATLQHEAEQNEMDRQLALVNRAIDKELKSLDQFGVDKSTRDKIKAELAKEVMKIRSTERLASMKAPADMLPKPPVEPPGRAPAGQSFQR